jgi:XTP/dITP diphosphohydrolase
LVAKNRKNSAKEAMNIKLIVVATNNAHKTSEISQMLTGVQLTNLSKFQNAPKPLEDAPDFVGNAIKKSVTIAHWLASSQRETKDWFVLADDSGLEVDGLNGAPGVHSARFANLESGAAGNAPDSANNAKLLRLLAAHPRPWTARFRCVLALTPVIGVTESNTCFLDEAEAATLTFDGACEGEIIPDSKGGHGFGYDPLFVPRGYSQTFAELGDEVKNKISHRALALAKLRRVI